MPIITYWRYSGFSLTLFSTAFAFLLAVFSPSNLAQTYNPGFVRGVHAMGDWLGNPRGFKEPLLADAGTLTVANVSSVSSRDNQLDLAQVTLTSVTINDSIELPKAGFWVYKEIASGNVGVQFKPSLDPNLAGIDGFTDAEINISWDSSQDAVWVDGLNSVSGDALQLILGILNSASEFLVTGSFVVNGEAVFGSRESLISAMTSVRGSITKNDDLYFGFLKSMNVEWIGISVGMHYDSYSDPTVKYRNCPDGFQDSSGNWIPCALPDDDLKSFISRARSRGFKIYMTLAFETSADTDSVDSPVCGTPDYKVSRWLMGIPELPSWHDSSKCVPADAWWWNPSHPDYAKNTGIFWDTYTQVAVHFAELAEAAGVELFSLGTETQFLFRTRPSISTSQFFNSLDQHFLNELTSMVSSVRAVYSGALTYDQHYGTYTLPGDLLAGAEGNYHIFNDLDLDVVGLSSYFPLLDTAPNQVVSLEELEIGWREVFEKYLVSIRERYPDKPIMFLEMGYTDHVNAPYSPYSGETEFKPEYSEGSPTPGMIQQQRIYESFYKVNAEYDDLVSGTFLWGHDYFPFNDNHSCQRIDYGLLCSAPARNALTAAYAAWQEKNAVLGGDSGISGPVSPPNEPIPGAVKTITLGGQARSAQFSLGAYAANGAPTYSTEFLSGEFVSIIGEVVPDPVDVGKEGKLFVVMLSIAGGKAAFSFLNEESVFETWDTTLAGLGPSAIVVPLEEVHEQSVFEGHLQAGVYKVTFAYQAEGGPLVYMKPITIRVTN